MNFLTRELRHFQLLNASARNLILSCIAYYIAAPLLGLFTNAYIWRQTQSMDLVALYNAGWISGVTLAFIVNGFLLRRIPISYLYASGLFLQSAASLVLFTIDTISLLHVLCVGLFLGFMAGIYWSNRNLLTFQVTRSKERDYYCSLESFLGTLFSCISPALFGLFLQIAEYAKLFEMAQRYRILMIVVIVIQAVGSLVILRSPFQDSEPKKIFLTHPSRYWKQARIFTMIKGIAEGSVLFFPSLTILLLVGQEGILGAVQSGAVIFSSAVLYFIARWMTMERRYTVLAFAILCIIVAALIFTTSFNSSGAIIYVMLQTLGVSLLWSAANPIILDAISFDAGDADRHYEYIVDREIALNVGRAIGIMVFLVLVEMIGQEASLRITPLILAGLLSLLLVSGKRLIGKRETNGK